MNHRRVSHLFFLLLALILGVDATFQVCSISLPVEARVPRVAQSVPDAPIAQKDTQSAEREWGLADALAAAVLRSDELQASSKPRALRRLSNDRFSSESTLQSQSIRLNT